MENIDLGVNTNVIVSVENQSLIKLFITGLAVGISIIIIHKITR